MPAPILGLRTAIYKVGDLARAKAWYAEAFQVEPYFDEEFYVGFNVAGYELGLMREEASGASKTANVLTYWGVEDIDTAVRTFLDLGATAHESPMNVGGDIMVASVKDPWGNVLGLIYNPDFELP